MISRFYFLILFSLISIVTTQAQYTRSKPYHQQLYVGVGGGANYYMAEGYMNYAIGDALGAVGNIAVGYQFHPLLALQGELGLSSHSWPNKTNNFQTDKFAAQYFKANAHFDLINALAGYNSHRLCQLQLLAGGGIAHRNSMTNAPDLNSFIINVGAQMDMAISSSFCFYLKAEGSILDDNYNAFVNPQSDMYSFDMCLTLSAGLKYKFETNNRIIYRSRIK